MAKAKIKNKQLPTAAPEKTEITGDHIPTPQDLPQRKPSLVASKLAGWCRHTLDSPLQHLPDLTLSTQVCNITSPSPHSTTCPLPPYPTQQEPTPSKLANWYLQFLSMFVFHPTWPCYDYLLYLFLFLLLPQTDCPSLFVLLHFHVPFYFLFTSM